MDLLFMFGWMSAVSIAALPIQKVPAQSRIDCVLSGGDSQVCCGCPSRQLQPIMTDHKSSIRIMPGAKEFIERMESLGVTVMYNLNRPEAIRKATIETLAQRGHQHQRHGRSSDLSALAPNQGIEQRSAPRRRPSKVSHTGVVRRSTHRL